MGSKDKNCTIYNCLEEKLFKNLNIKQLYKKNALLKKTVLLFCLKSLVLQAYLMLTGKMFQSRCAAAMEDRSPMVTFVKRFGMLRRIPLSFRRKS